MFFNVSDDLYVITAKDSHVKHSQRINKMYKRVKKQMRREQNNIRYMRLCHSGLYTHIHTTVVSVQLYMKWMRTGIWGWKLLSRAMKNSTKSKNHEEKILRRQKRSTLALLTYTNYTRNPCVTGHNVFALAPTVRWKRKGERAMDRVSCTHGEWSICMGCVCVVVVVKWNFTSLTLSFIATWKVSLCGPMLFRCDKHKQWVRGAYGADVSAIAFVGIKKQLIALWILIQIW